MTSRLLLYLCFLTWKSGLCQTTVPVPIVDFSGNRLVQFVREIQNPTPDPINFSFAHIPQTDSLLLAYLISYVTNPMDTEQSKIELVNAVGAFLKSPRFQNGPLVFDISASKADTALFRKEHSLVGAIHTMHSAQCGNWCDRARILLIKTGFFHWTDFEQVSLPKHQLLHVKLSGYFSLVDFDPGTGCFMFPFSGSLNGFANHPDVKANPQLIAGAYPYLYNGQPLEGIGTLQEYMTGLLDSADIFTATPWIDSTDEITGEFVLPGNSTLKLRSSWIFMGDTTLSETLAWRYFTTQMVDSILSDSCEQCVIHLIDGINSTFQTQQGSLMFSDSSGLLFYNSTIDQGQPIDLSWYWRQNQPTFELTIEPRNDTIKISSEEDVKSPLFVLDIKGAGSWQIGDTLGSGDANFELWSHEVSPVRNHREVNYLDSGFILAYQGTTLQLAINQNMLGFTNEWTLEGGAGLVTSAYTIIANGGAGLPVTLVSFTTEPQKKSIRLAWITASERDNDRFVVEKSTDGLHFTDIQSVSGQGDSDTWHEYEIDDLDVVPNMIYYYRLRQEDYDNAVSYSEIRTAQILEGLVLAKIFTLGGQHIATQEIDAQDPTRYVNGLPSGVYILVFENIDSARMITVR